MHTIRLLSCFAIVGYSSLTIAEIAPNQIKADEIVSLQRIAMLFDGGSIQFRFEMSSGSLLELRINDRKQMGGLLQGVSEGSESDWWVWVVGGNTTVFLDPETSENMNILNMLSLYLKSNRDIDSHARQELLELMAILKDRKRTKVSYNFWTGFRNDAAK